MTPKREIYVLVDKRLPEDSDYEKSYAALGAPSQRRLAARSGSSWTARLAKWLGVETRREVRQSGDFSRYSESEQGEDSSNSHPWEQSGEFSDPDEHPSRPAA